MVLQPFALLLLAGMAATPGIAAGPAKPAISLLDRAAIFKAAGAAQRGGKWVICTDDPQAEGASIEQIADLNGDGRLDAVVTEGGTFCYGNTGTGFQLLSKQPNGSWRQITGDTGIPSFLKTKGVGGWPDIEVGGPGFCFPVQRWNGREYAVLRFQYDGKACRPGR